MPNCDIGENNREISYDQPWLSNAIPSSSGTFDSCSHYALKDNILIRPGQCNANVFNTSMKVKCSEFVYASDEKNLQTEVSQRSKQFLQEKCIHFEYFSLTFIAMTFTN